MKRGWWWLVLFWAGGALAQLPVVEVYKSPSCECCKHWIRHLEEQGFPVRAINTDEVVRHKYRLGVPPGYGSCHTAEVAGYVIEGHVPAREIKRLLKERPKARGLTVPGMPIGSPGMEQGSRRDPYEVLLITPQGDTRVYARY
ncbi:MAG: DUF411 domain-containing protein [Anaerolineae bacterium]|nr:DUF411 domain-containing protein [Anaerolineae bacterium]